MKDEYFFRKNNGFECELLDKTNNFFPFPIKQGIFAKNGGCELNPYLFTKQMVENAKNQDKIFENTNITQIEKSKSHYIAITNYGERIICNKIVIATGFNWEVLGRDDLCTRYITYSVVTSPIKDFIWKDRALIHDATSPYHYLRTLPDGRLIFGGEDTIFKGKPIQEKKCNKIYDKLEKDLFKLLPEIKNTAKIDYKFCGCFGTTLNNLGLIGESKFDDNILLFISCGANGIINAVEGASVKEDILNKRFNPLAKLFSPKREV